MRGSNMTRLALIGAAVIAVGGCAKPGGSGGGAADSAAIAAAARANVAGISAAYNAHDAAKAASYDAADYVSMFHGFATAIGPVADAASMREQFKDPAARFDLQVQGVDVAQAGDMAVVRTRYTYHFTDPATKAIGSETGNWLAGFKRQADGSLKMAWSIGADEPAAAAGPKP